VFAIRLVEIDARGAEMFVPLAFLIIIGTVVLQGTTSKYIAGWLGVRDPAPSGFLVVGGRRVGRMLAIALHEQGIRVLVADSDGKTSARREWKGWRPILETRYRNMRIDILT